eukprot:Colp12_sorted_trinity150504_noHs@20942
MRPFFNQVLDALVNGNNATCQTISAFAAQVGHESNGLMYFEELASGAEYEGRCTDLGNCEAGDGMKYKGRGPIQLTGKTNYVNFANDFKNSDYWTKPDTVSFPSVGFKAAQWFWQRHNLNQYCTGSEEDFVKMTKVINGGTNGLEDRKARWAKAKQLLGC